MKCLRHVHVTFSLCALRRPLRSKCLFKCINCRRDCVTTSELSDTLKENIRTCCPRFQSVRARRSGFESLSCRLSVKRKVLSALLWCRMGEAAANIVIMTCQHVQGKKKSASLMRPEVSLILTSLSRTDVPWGNTKARPPGNYRPEVDACLDSALGQKPTIRSRACGRKKRTACYFLTYPRMTLTPSLPGAQAQRAGVCPHWRHMKGSRCLSSERANFHEAGVLLARSWLRSGR